MKDYKDKLKDFFEPDLLKFNLTFISVFIAIYENFKETMISNVKSFYCNGFKNGKEIYENYEKEVLGLVKTEKDSKQIKATIEWLIIRGAFNERDKTTFKNATDMRGSFAHDMSSKLFEGISDDAFELFVDMVKMFKKFDIWWISEIELPISGEFTAEQQDDIDWDGVTSMNRLFLEIMCDIALTGNDKYSKMMESMS